MLWSSAKMESRELTGEPEPTQQIVSDITAEAGSRNPKFYYYFTSFLLELARGFEPPTG